MSACNSFAAELYLLSRNHYLFTLHSHGLHACVQAEAYRGEAATLQSRIRELEEQEREADARANELAEALQQLQASHRHTLEALELTERISACREQEANLRSQAKALSSEVGQLDRETTGLQDKTAQLRQQLTSASHAACSEDVANLMLVVQQMTSKTTNHRQLQQQRREELEGNTSECRRLAGDVALMLQRAEHLLHARETQNQVGRGCCLDRFFSKEAIVGCILHDFRISLKEWLTALRHPRLSSIDREAAPYVELRS